MFMGTLGTVALIDSENTHFNRSGCEENNKKDSPDCINLIKDFENRNLLTRTVNLHKVQILKDFSRNTSPDAASIKINSFEIGAKLFEI